MFYQQTKMRPHYILMISINRKNYVLDIIRQVLNIPHPKTLKRFLIIIMQMDFLMLRKCG